MSSDFYSCQRVKECLKLLPHNKVLRFLADKGYENNWCVLKHTKPKLILVSVIMNDSEKASELLVEALEREQDSRSS